MSRSSVFTAIQAAWRRVFVLGALVAGLGVTASTAAAQTSTGGIRGYVRDESGAPVPNVQIVARHVDMGLTRSATTNESGFYSLAGLRPGDYELSTRRIGFGPQARRITVMIGVTAPVDFRLSQAATQLAAVTVTATESDVRTPESGTNISQTQIRDLPNQERNFLDLGRLAPGITPQAVNDQDKHISAGSQPYEAINVFIDGASYKSDVLRGGVAGQDASKGNPFPQGAVQEFRVITQNYKAEYQKASSAIITATTRSGGNQWEGDLFAFGIGNSYSAKSALAVRNNLSAPNYKRLQAGGSIGGPIQRDKLFFFGTYELNFRDEPQYVTGGSDTLQAPPSLDWRQYTGQFTSEFRQHLAFGKLTWAKSDRSTVEASLNYRHETDFRGFGGALSYQFSENMLQDVWSGIANWRYAGDRWLNEAQVNGQHFVWNPRPLNTNIIGQDYFGIIRIGGRDAQQNFTQNRVSLRDDITRSAARWFGDHVLKFGANVDFLTYDAIKEQQMNPVFRYRSDENWSRPFEAAFGFGDPNVSTNNTQFGVYAQDDWNITPKFTVNLGIRWDAETNMINNSYVTPQPLRDSLSGPLRGRFLVDKPKPRADGTCCDVDQIDVIGELGGLDRFLTNGRSDRPMYLGAFQPRLGASYDLKGDGRTVLFGGAGVYYDRNYWNSMFDERFRRQYHVLRVTFNDVGPIPTCQNCVAWDPRYYDPAQLRTLAGTAGVDEVFLVANDLKPPKTYQFTGGIRQAIGRTQLSLSYNGSRGRNGFNFVKATNWGGLGPTYAQAFVTDDRVKTWYDALQLQLDRPLRAGMRWGGSLAYTYAKSESRGRIDDFFWDFNDQHPTVADMPRQKAPNNQAHTIAANGIVRLPFDFLASAIVNLGSGLTVNATDASAGWDFWKQSVYVYSPPTKPFLGIGHVFSTQNLDLRLQKDFPVAAGQNVGLIVDLYNALNTANWGCYDATIRPPGDAGAVNYGVPGCSGLGRRLQIGLRYGYRPSSAENGR
jgi:hypothetical protein